MKKTFFALLAIVFLFSCSGEPFDINKEGGTVFILACSPKAGKNDIEATQVILSRRLENFGISESERKIYINRQNQIIVEVAGHYPKERLRKLLQATAELGFFETYENSDTYSYLTKLNDELAAEMARDSSISFGTDSSKRKYPLLGLLKINIFQRYERPYQMEVERGCRIGFAELKDTASLNRMLHSETARLLLPFDMCLAWGIRPEEMENRLPLYALKTKGMDYPVLGGEVITDAHKDKDQYTGRLVVSLNMNEQGARQWEEITERNMKKSIAIVLDGYVYTAPIVENKIPNGRSVISGGFTVEETEDLANVLKSSRLPVSTRIIDEKTVEPKK